MAAKRSIGIGSAWTGRGMEGFSRADCRLTLW